jgi:hypothetical protein
MSKEEVIGLGVRKSVWGEYNMDTGASGGPPPCPLWPLAGAEHPHSIAGRLGCVRTYDLDHPS